VYSTDKSGNYEAVNGTSFATPFVTSTLARYKSEYQSLKASELKNTLLTYSNQNTKLE
jgi:subtilisin family serine protease